MSTAVLKTIEILQRGRDAQQRTLADLDQAIVALRRLAGEQTDDAAPPASKTRRPGRRPAARKTPAHAPALGASSSGPVHTTRAGMATPAPRDIVAARDEAVLARLRKGPAPFATLREAMPVEPELTEEQRTRACSNALTRLRGRKRIQSAGDGTWTLA